MLPVPPILIHWLAPFAAFFTKPTWERVLVLATGAILAPGRRTVTAVLSVLGRRDGTDFARFHGVLNRARWSGRSLARALLRWLVAVFVPDGPVVVGIDETIERRWGPKISARGIYRDPVRSSHGHFVKASGLRWISVMLLAPIPWAGRIWGLPFLTALAPSERHARQAGVDHVVTVSRLDDDPGDPGRCTADHVGIRGDDGRATRAGTDRVEHVGDEEVGTLLLDGDVVLHVVVGRDAQRVPVRPDRRGVRVRLGGTSDAAHHDGQRTRTPDHRDPRPRPAPGIHVEPLPGDRHSGATASGGTALMRRLASTTEPPPTGRRRNGDAVGRVARQRADR